jgi:hypothetical protein
MELIVHSSKATRERLMEAAESTYFYALCATSTTFVGFSALIMLVRQSMGDGVSELEAWITRTFVQLGFKVTAGALSPAALALCHVRTMVIWRLCSAVLATVLFLFVVTYPSRRRRVARAPAPLFVYLDLFLLLAACSVLASNATGWTLEPNAGLYAIGLTSILFVSGLGYLHALGAVRQRRDRLEEN